MIYITGDTHGDYAEFVYRFKDYNLTSEDTVIIMGDFGFVWGKSTERNIKLLSGLTFNIAFIDGNHENFSLLNSYPVECFNGGKIHRISENTIHLMRGQCFTIENKTFFTMGGAYSVDRHYRVEKLSWWQDELPSNEEYNSATETLERHAFNFDYILSHTIPLSVYYKMYRQPDQHELELSGYLQWIYEKATFIHWYAGHHHINKTFNDFTILYDNVIKIE